MQFFLGTTNPYKVREIGSILIERAHSLTPVDVVDPEETGSTFEENSALKARAYAAHTGGLTISEDSGLVIPVLGGYPGVWSARFADYKHLFHGLGPGRYGLHVPSHRSREEMDKANCERVLQLMDGIRNRKAIFKVVLTVALPNGDIQFQATGESHGMIAEGMRGTDGFGYDPIFIGDDTFGHTYAELDSARKNLRSHRRQVLEKFAAFLDQAL